MKDFLKKLVETCSPSGDEKDGINLWDNECEKLKGEGIRKYYSDKMGNSAWAWGNGSTKILISGHVDEICMAVNYIDESGYIVLSNMAGIDLKVLPGSQLLLVTQKEIIRGVIVSVPIHIYWGEDKKDDVTPIDELRVDIGAESKEEVIEMGVNIGIPVVFERNVMMKFGKNRLVGNALDDKAGVAVVYNVLKKLNSELPKELKEKITVIGLATVGEESGLRGAMVAAKNINADISIDIDVTYADCGLYNKEKYGDVKLGKGVIIEYGQDKSRRLSDKLKDICEKEGISYQLSNSRCGGTNTDMIQLMSEDCETTLLSLPLTSLHTQNETMDWRDLEGCSELILKYISSEF